MIAAAFRLTVMSWSNRSSGPCHLSSTSGPSQQGFGILPDLLHEITGFLQFGVRSYVAFFQNLLDESWAMGTYAPAKTFKLSNLHNPKPMVDTLPAQFVEVPCRLAGRKSASLAAFHGAPA